MKRSKILILTMMSLAMAFASCEKTLEVEEPAERELVLNAVPAAGRQAFVHFAHTRFFLDDNNDQPVDGADIVLSINGTPMLPCSTSHCKYFFNHILQEDDSLSIDIHADGRSVHAHTYVPLYPVVSNFQSLFAATETFNIVAATFTLSDHANRDEYYKIHVQVRDSGIRYNEWTTSYDTVDSVHSAMFTVPMRPEITSSEVAAYSPMGGNLMFLDRKIDGQDYYIPLWIILLKDTNEVAPFKHEYTVDIESVTPARFMYLLSSGSQNSLTSFFAEQGRVYSNIDGALGIFAGSAKRRYTFALDTILPPNY